ncbi:ricin-type beta-trefoil lectin protein [Kordia periserrulae]|uniref:Ricin-type beta-trefoil lectin protein n=1 Tax=Kordia periserrulae TaxID=701523 RepID=A0A2T6C128_9FLAO|nr:RICIN domain-containing protein [Kordia periserrulae]PTX62015.1 ricin-type beta-trefoil lectin protein [Kordia periserrulae]
MKSLSHTLKQYCFTLLFCIISTSIYAQNPVQKGQWYVIESYEKGRVLQVQPPYENNGVAVVLAQQTNQNNQLFRFEEIGNGFYIIRSKEQNKVLDIRGGSQENNAVVQVWNQANVENQKFKLVLATGDGHYYITAKHSNKSISAAAGFPVGSTIVQKYADGLANAMFKFIPYTPKKEKPKPAPKPQPIVNSSIPTLTAPASNFIVENKKGSVITFNWSRVANASSYQIIIQHENQKNTLLNTTVNATNYRFVMNTTIDATLINDTWRWWVRAKVGNEWSKWSQSRILDFKQPIPSTITLIYPQSNATLANGIVNTNKTYVWNFDWADVPNAEQYEIYIIHPNNNKKSFIQNTPVSNYQLVQRQHRTNNELNGWQWKVRVFINGSYSAWSTTKTFNVAPAKKQQTPVNPTPIVVTNDNFITQSSSNFNKAVKNNFAVELTNKINNRTTSLGYNVQKNHFKMGEFFKNWRIKRVRNGIYQLQVEIDGKFWSLASEGNQRGDVKLTVDDRNDNYQLWKIIQQADGYYKIVNVGNENETTISADTLFYSIKSQDFFLSSWKPNKTNNGRWYFDAKNPINVKPKPIEDRIFRMNASNGKRVCLNYIMTSDVTGYNSLNICGKYDDNNTLFKFERTTNGNYLIKVKSSKLARNEWHYLTGDIELQEIERYKDAPVKGEYGMYWHIISKGNGNYTFYNVDTKRAFEFVQRSYGFPREFIESRKLANKREQYFKLY